MLLRRYKGKLIAMCRLFISSASHNYLISFDELYSIALEALYCSMKKYDPNKDSSFYTYSMNTIQKELTRYFIKCLDYYRQSNISLDSISKEEGLYYDELIGCEDEKIKQIYLNPDLHNSINEGEFSGDEYKEKDYAERIHILMLELTGQYNLTRDEIIKLKRHIKYWVKKKELK